MNRTKVLRVSVTAQLYNQLESEARRLNLKTQDVARVVMAQGLPLFLKSAQVQAQQNEDKVESKTT